MLENVAELGAVQLGVGRHRGQPGVPDAVEQFEIMRRVPGGDGDAVAGRKTELVAQAGGEPARPLGELRKARHDSRAGRDRRQRAVFEARGFKRQSEVHTPPRSSSGYAPALSQPKRIG